MGPRGTPFDLVVRAVDNQLYVEVIDDPDGAHKVKTYPIITDGDNPILAGSVGFASWGNGGGLNNGVFYSSFGRRRRYSAAD